MRLVIQIPCFDEAETLPATLADLPRSVEGFDEVLVLVVDDGSTDGTADAARAGGADRVVRLPENRGLANAFRIGLDESLKMGADVVVNTDGDNQYRGADVARLVEPILDGRADMTVGARDMSAVGSFSTTKKILQKLGSAVTRRISGTRVQDATSGFRAFSRDAALRLNVFTHFTYTLETLIQAGRSHLTIESVPIRTNEARRASRLFHGNAGYIARSIMTMLRIYTLYQPFKVFLALASAFLLVGAAIGMRFVYFIAFGGHEGHVQSLILAAVCLIVGFLLFVFGLIADTNAANRRLMEDALTRLRRIELHPRHPKDPEGPASP